MDYKKNIRNLLNFLHLDITKNLEYDRLTKRIIGGGINKNFNCIDIGCHKGEILEYFLKYAPLGTHYAFEPIPYLFQKLKTDFANKDVNIFPYALSDKDGNSTFQYVKNAPAYSGLLKRKYDIDNPDIEEIVVEMKKLDEIIPSDQRIDFVKIDVEGAELGVLKGGINLLKNNKPAILFEFGKGASDYYNTTPKDIYNLITNEIGLNIYLLKSYIKNRNSLTLEKFSDYYNDNSEYYFIAANH